MGCVIGLSDSDQETAVLPRCLPAKQSCDGGESEESRLDGLHVSITERPFRLSLHCYSYACRAWDFGERLVRGSGHSGKIVVVAELFSFLASAHDMTLILIRVTDLRSQRAPRCDSPEASQAS